MARINFPDSFAQQKALLDDIKAKHATDGATSDLNPYLSEQNIDIAADVAAGTQAAVHETARSLYSKQAEGYKQLRDNGFDPVWKRFQGSVQYLKGLYRGKERQLGEWGITVDAKNKITYPADFDGQSALIGTFMAKHASFPDTDSPLNPYIAKQGINTATDAQAVTAAGASHQSMGGAQMLAEDEKAQRDHLWMPVAGRMRGMVDFLKKLNRDNAKALGAYNIVVDDSPRTPRLRNTMLKLGEQITVNGVTIGGTLTNTGTGDLHVYRGKTTTGTPTIVHGGEQLGMLKGWSTITVVNPSTLVGGKFSVLISNT